MSSPEQDALLALQDLDTSVEQHRHRRAALPERAELAAIDGRLVAAEAARAKVSARGAEVAARQSVLEADMAASESRIAEVNRRLKRGEISAAREVAVVSESLDHLRARVSDLEDHILEAMDERAPLDDRVVAIDAELVDLFARREGVVDGLAEGEAGIDAELVVLEAARRQASGAVDARHLADYERLRSRLGGVAVARLVGTRCDGCHLTLPATEIDRLRHLPADAIAQCDHCGRFLVRPS